MIDDIKFEASQEERPTHRPESPAKGESAPEGLSAIRSAGILFDAQNEHSRDLLKGFLRAVKPFNIPLAILGLDKPKSTLPPLEIPYIPCTSKDFSLFGRIKDGAASAFIQKPFDILIDMSLSGGSKAGKIDQGSKAGFKIGINKDEDLFDFMFSMPSDGPENPEAFANLLECLGKINRK